MNFRLAMVQHKITEPDVAENTRIGLDYLREAARQGADLVLYPECFLTSYSFPPIAKTDLPLADIERDPAFRAWADSALTEHSAALTAFRDTARELGVGAVITAFTKGNRRPQNTAFVLGKDGAILMRYSKVHTCDFDAERVLEPGQEFRVCDFDGVQLGVMICYDREYPESARVLMLKGAEIIVVPNDCCTMFPRLQALSTRAYENMVGVAMANPPGFNAGNSCAYSPIIWDDAELAVDNTLLLADATTTGLFCVDFDLDALRDYRAREMQGNTFRKVAAYGPLLEGAVEPPFRRGER